MGSKVQLLEVKRIVSLMGTRKCFDAMDYHSSCQAQIYQRSLVFFGRKKSVRNFEGHLHDSTPIHVVCQTVESLYDRSSLRYG